MNDTVRILVLEAKTANYNLAQNEIRKSIINCTFEQAKTRKDFLTALKLFQPDVILADDNLPRFNGMKALELAREHTPLTPVIIWMETTNHEAAVEYIKAGAKTYILKEDVNRLGGEMICARRESKLLIENRQLEDALINIKERFDALVMNGRENISLLDAKGDLIWESPSATSTLGYAMNEFKGRNIFELVHPDDQYWTLELFDRLVKEPGRRQEGLFRLRHSDGTWRWIEGTAKNLLDNPSVQAIVINYRDVTERKEADARIRESEERFSKAFNLGPAALSISQLNGGSFLAVNEAYLNLYGYEYNEVVGHTPLELNMYPDENESALAMKLLHEQTDFRDQEFRIRTKSGEARIVISSGESIELGGEKYLLSFTTDITERKQAEMERQALLEIMQGLAQTNDLQEFLERIHYSVAKAIYAENFFVVLYHRDTGLFEEIYSVDQYDPPAPPSNLEKSITSYVFRSGEPVLMTQSLFDELADQGEVQMIGTNSASWLGVPLKTPNEIIGVIAVQDYENPNRYSERERDFLASIGSQVAIAIERKRAEDTLYDSEKRFRNLFENSPISLWEEDFSGVQDKFTLLKEQGIDDIEAFIRSNPEFVAECASSIKVLDVNNATLKLFEADSKEELIAPLSRILRPENLVFFTDELVYLAAGKTSFYWEGFNQTIKGRQIYVNLKLSVLPRHESTLSNVIVSIFDITQRKQAEQALHNSEQRFRALFEDVPIAIWEEDFSELKNHLESLKQQGGTDFRAYLRSHPDEMVQCEKMIKVLDANNTALEMYQANSKEELIKIAMEVPSAGELENSLEDLLAIAEGRTSREWEGSDETLTGKPIDIKLSWSVVPGYENDFSKVIVTTEDITERKQAEEALRQSEERFRSLFDRMMDGVYRSTHEGRFVDVNPALVKMFGFSSEEEMLKVDIKNDLYFAPEERGSHILDTGTEETDIYRMRRKDGSEIWVEDHGSYIHDDEGNILFHEGILRDITERKQVEESLRESQAQFSIAFEHAPIGMALVAPDGHWIRANHALEKLIGYTERELLSKTFQEITHPDDLEKDLNYVDQVLMGKINSYQMEKRYFHKSGDIIWVLLGVSLIKDNHGNPQYFISQIQDITEQKRTEAETLRHLTELKALYENGLAVSRLLKPGEIGEQVIETFARHLSWHHVAIRLRKNEDDLELIAFNEPGLSVMENNEMERNFSSMVSKVGQGLSGWVAETGKPLRIGDVRTHSQYVETQAGIQSGLYMPLKIGERVLGVISVESELLNAFSAEDERLLATLANQAAVAFENAHLYQAARQEIAERLRAETALRTSETHYRDLADSITDIMFEMDQNMQFTHWNRSSELLTGIPKEEALGRSTREVFGDSREQMEVERIYLNVLSNRAPKSFEAFLKLNRDQRAYEINAYPSTSGVSVVAKDITERKVSAVIMQKRFELMNFSAHNPLEDLMQKMLDELIELIPSQIGFFHFMQEDESTPGKQMWSTKTLQLFNVPAGEGNHRSVNQAGVWADAVRQRRALIQNDYNSIPKKKGLPSGHAIVARELVIPIIRNEKIKAVLGIANKEEDYTQQDIEMAVRYADHAWDIIERKNMEVTLAEERNQLAKRVEARTSDLSRANSNLARALRVKDEFLANMSHELRTPLNAILGLSESLGEQTAGPLNEKQLRYITTIGESGHHLLSLINDILDLAKIDAGQITLNINKVDINSICEASLRLVKQLAQKKNQDMNLDIDNDIGLMWADERRLKQMLVNLLSNAVKFTPENGKLGLEVRGDQSENQVSFAVWDNGIGIKDNDLSLLFQPFIQLDGGLDRENAGTGLGLALVAQMARLHGGSVTVESVPQQGSRFTITLPWEPALAPDTAERMRITGKLPSLPPEDNRKHTLLLIEDTQEVTMMLKDYLENVGYQVVTAQDGLEGLEQAKLTHPDLILMDIQMPRIDGFEATKRLRDDPEFEHTPIIALTALAMPNDRERCLAAGMDEYISKPVNLKMLLKIIQGCLSPAKESAKPR